MDRVNFLKRMSYIFLVVCFCAIILCGTSIFLQHKDKKNFTDCTEAAQATLGSYMTESKTGITYYYGVYTFQYNKAVWHYIDRKSYTKKSKVPASITVKHNKFTSKENMNVYCPTSTGSYIPYIYIILAVLCFVIFILYRSKYNNELLLVSSKQPIPEEIN